VRNSLTHNQDTKVVTRDRPSSKGTLRNQLVTHSKAILSRGILNSNQAATHLKAATHLNKVTLRNRATHRNSKGILNRAIRNNRATPLSKGTRRNNRGTSDDDEEGRKMEMG
jgi:hypothetical protein